MQATRVRPAATENWHRAAPSRLGACFSDAVGGAAALPGDGAALEASVAAQAAVVRGLKEGGAAKGDPQLVGAVAELLRLKAAVTAAAAGGSGGGAGAGAGGEGEGLGTRELRAARLEKVAAMRSAGVEPFAYTFAATHSAAALGSQFEALAPGEEDAAAAVALAGRILTRRIFGKLMFFTVQDQSGTFQLYCEKKKLGAEAFGRLKVHVWLAAAIPDSHFCVISVPFLCLRPSCYTLARLSFCSFLLPPLSPPLFATTSVAVHGPRSHSTLTRAVSRAALGLDGRGRHHLFYHNHFHHHCHCCCARTGRTRATSPLLS